MKTIISCLLCMIFSIITFGQDKRQSIGEIQVTPPKFIGSQYVLNNQANDINEYLIKNIQYPETDGKKFIQGTEVVRFVVTPTGNITDYKVINSVSFNIDEEVIRVLESTNGMWSPGKNNGEPVAMRKEISVAFKVGDDVNFQSIALRFYNRGAAKLLVKHNAKQALSKFNNGILYLPNDLCLLMLKGLCLYELGEVDDAREQWSRMKQLGGIDMESITAQNYTDLEGYEEMISLLEK